MMKDGKMIVVSAPSGSGKTSIVKELIKSGLGLVFSVSACSRSPRAGETDAVDYFFLSQKEFKEKISNKEFVEWEEVYPGNYYGTLHSEIRRIWNQGKHVIFDVDVKGGLNIKAQYPDNCLAIFISTPSPEELENRLRKRSTENEDALRKRLDKAAYEMSFADQFDKIVVNDKLDIAIEEAKKLVKSFLAD